MFQWIFNNFTYLTIFIVHALKNIIVHFSYLIFIQKWNFYWSHNLYNSPTNNMMSAFDMWMTGGGEYGVIFEISAVCVRMCEQITYVHPYWLFKSVSSAHTNTKLVLFFISFEMRVRQLHSLWDWSKKKEKNFRRIFQFTR